MIRFDHEAFIDAVVEANREIYRLLKTPPENLFQPLQKGAGGDITHGIDQVAEDIFVRRLKRFGKIKSEESGLIGDGEYMITLDPLDGSDNFLSGFPYYGSSVAIENTNGDVEVGIVTNLAQGRIYIKRAENFFCADLVTLQQLAQVHYPDPKIGIFERAYCSFENADRLKKAAIKYRIPGAIALSLALAREVAFVILEGEMRTFDVKAGLFMCEDLYQHKTNDLTIICHQEKMFNRLKQILLEDK